MEETTVKFQGGPNDREIKMVQGNAPHQIKVTGMTRTGPLAYALKDGFYARTTVTQKNGARIYKWIGWDDGTF